MCGYASQKAVAIVSSRRTKTREIGWLNCVAAGLTASEADVQRPECRVPADRGGTGLGTYSGAVIFRRRVARPGHAVAR